MLRLTILLLASAILIACTVVTMNAKLEIKSVKKSTAQKELGHLLFFDRRLSYDLSKSCSSCHDPLLAFSDGYKVSFNNNAEALLRNSPTLLNINERQSFNWANSKITTLRQQMQRPLFNIHPIELGLIGHEKIILRRFQIDSNYKKIYSDCYHIGIQNITTDDIIEAISSYILNLQSRNSRYDQFLSIKDSTLLNGEEWLGFNLFNSDSIGCGTCHGGKDFFEPIRGRQFANIGLYNCNNSYPASDLGLQEEDNDSNYNGVFRIPTLRNISLTAPYYHDGSEESLQQVILNYERGGRIIIQGSCAGDGNLHPNKDGRLQSFTLDEKKRNSIISFLNTLTDTTYLQNPIFRNPFENKD
ncbi:MAG: cytochrome c peroxidase [Saprospiraceae bacterium]